ncbi:hypothetical protein EIP86_004492 [Pleurotus ostreatoroseus]|nr:hypothetical protein EIP86_004492 [Pleurotus ostreatoroseus]
MKVLTAASTQNLQEITLVWNDRCNFPPQTQLPKLETLRLWLQNNYRDFSSYSLDSITPYTSITRLMLHNSTDGASMFLEHYLHSVSFPNLRILNLREVFAHNVDWIFDFVQRHSTLFEVNLELGEDSVRFESVVKLIQEMEDGWLEGDYLDAHLPHFLKLLAHFPDLEELRVSSCNPQREIIWSTFMVSCFLLLSFQLNISCQNDITNSLSHFSCLRNLAIHWLLDDLEWEDEIAEERVWTPFLDEVSPPYDISNQEIRDYNLENIEGILKNAGLEQNVWKAPEWPDNLNERLDEEDEHLALRAWKALHETSVRSHMHALAKRCPMLEEIEWYLRWSSFDEIVRWKWRVVRGKDGSASMLTDELSWPGHLGGDPQPMLMLVGEELKYAKRSGQGRWRQRPIRFNRRYER